jgi:hypothetical protein
MFYSSPRQNSLGLPETVPVALSPVFQTRGTPYRLQRLHFRVPKLTTLVGFFEWACPRGALCMSRFAG